MTMKKHISLFSAAAALAAGLQAPAALAVNPCISDIPTSGTVTVPCGPTAGPRAVGHAKWNSVGPGGTTLFYDIDLKIGVSAGGLPVKADGQSQVEKQGGGFCPGLTDQIPGSPSPVTGTCSPTSAFRAKKYRVTVG